MLIYRCFLTLIFLRHNSYMMVAIDLIENWWPSSEIPGGFQEGGNSSWTYLHWTTSRPSECNQLTGGHIEAGVVVGISTFSPCPTYPSNMIFKHIIYRVSDKYIFASIDCQYAATTWMATNLQFSFVVQFHFLRILIKSSFNKRHANFGSSSRFVRLAKWPCDRYAWSSPILPKIQWPMMMWTIFI